MMTSSSQISRQQHGLIPQPSASNRQHPLRQQVACHRSREETATAPQKPGKKEKSVRFAEFGTMVLMNYPSEREISKRWYTEQNMIRFQQIMCRDAARQSLVYLATKECNPNAFLPKEELIKCVGIFHLLSDDVNASSRESKLNRRAHSITVLEEQERQRELGGTCVKVLANVSRLSSKQARDTALKIAFLSAHAAMERRASC